MSSREKSIQDLRLHPVLKRHREMGCLLEVALLASEEDRLELTRQAFDIQMAQDDTNDFYERYNNGVYDR